MAPAPQWVTKDFLKHIIKRAIHREISISDDEIIDYISEKRNHKIKSTTWIVYVNDKINKEPELKELMCEHMETASTAFATRHPSTTTTSSSRVDGVCST